MKLDPRIRICRSRHGVAVYAFADVEQAKRFDRGVWPMDLNGRRLQMPERLALLGFR